jgi:hypothetical protein
MWYMWQYLIWKNEKYLVILTGNIMELGILLYFGVVKKHNLTQKQGYAPSILLLFYFHFLKQPI